MKTFKPGINYKVTSNEETGHSLKIGAEFTARKSHISPGGLIYSHHSFDGEIQKLLITECTQQQSKWQKPNVKLDVIKRIDIDNLKLSCEIELGGESFNTEIQYIISSNTAHHSDIDFENKMEEMGIDMSAICEGIENRDFTFN